MAEKRAGGWTEHTVTGAQAGQTVQEIVTGTMGVSRRQIQKLTRSRGIVLNRRPTYLAKPVQRGDVVAVRLGGEAAPRLAPVAMELNVVYEDAHLLVLDKPPYLLVHPTQPDQQHTLVHGVAHYYCVRGVRAGVHPVHRLDRDTSGLVVIAKDARTHQRLDEQLRARALRRRYLALVDGVLREDAGVVDAPIARHPTQPVLRAVRPDGEPARTRWRVIERFAAATLVELELETGRTHQIRVHLAHLGHPLLGDRQYGRRGLKLIQRQALHAWRLAFRHPASGEPVELEAALPPDMTQLRETLRGDTPGG